MTDPMIRLANQADWPMIWTFFREIIHAGRTIPYDPAITSDEAKALWMEGPPGRTVVYTDGRTIMGSAKMGPNRPGRGAHVATATFMVDPACEGRGVGRALGNHTLEWAASAGYRSMQFNAVVETNARAVALWTSLGFEIIGTVPEAFDHPDHGLVGLHVMYQRLGR